MLLQELHAINSSSEDLFEDYGNLKFIDRKFLPALKSITTVSVPQNSEYGYEHKTVLAKHPTLGQNSPIETIPFKTAAGPRQELEKVGALGFVISISDEQAIIVTQSTTKGDTTYTIGIDGECLGNLFSESDVENSLGDIFGETQKVHVHGNNGPKFGLRAQTKSVRVPAQMQPLEIRRGSSSVQLNKVIAAILKEIKAQKLTATITTFFKDPDRQATSIGRKNNRFGMAPRILDDKWKSAAKTNLRSRLDGYKSNKAVGVDKIEDLIAAITEKGYLDKIKIAGYAFDIDDSRNIDMRNLRNPTKTNYSYVEYKINQNTPEYEKYRQELKQYRYDTDEYKEFKKTVPFRTIKIKLKLVGGTIVPDEIVSGDNYFAEGKKKGGLLLTEKFNQEQTESWLKKMGIKNYTIKSNGVVDVDGDVDLFNRKLDNLPVTFGKVTGNFFVRHNNLKNLKRFPTFIGGDLSISYNLLITTFEGGPGITVKGEVLLSKIGITSLIGVSDTFKEVGNISFHEYRYEIDTHGGGIGLIQIDGTITIADTSYNDFDKAMQIIKPFLGRPDDLFECQEELINAKLDRFAVL